MTKWKVYEIGIWDSYDDEHKIVRFVTSWATTEDEIECLAECIQDVSI